MINSEFEKESPKSPDLHLTPLEKATGGTCRAYTARLSGKKVFVKEIKPEFADDARMLAAFRKEAEIGFRLDHRNLPNYIYAEGVLPSDRYIVQEFIDGETLPVFIKENPAFFRNRKNLERFIREFTDVIDYLHGNQIVHLDLKPENILISRVGTTLKLVDLGFCATDFYDDTRGFTSGELPPEGSATPSARGASGDFYGIGKILSYIHTNTPGFPGKKFRRLEAGLLNPAPTKRIVSKEEIDRILSRKVSVSLWWTAVSIIIIGVALVAFLLRDTSPAEHEAPAKETVAAQDIPDIKEPEATIADKEAGPGRPTVPGPATPAIPAVQNHPAPSPQARTGESGTPPLKGEADTAPTTPFPTQTYDKMKAEMVENISKNFAGLEKMLASYLREGKYTEQDYKTVNETYRGAIQKTFDTGRYKARYTDLSPSLIDDTMAELVQDAEKRGWGTAYKKYVRQYQEVASGSSK